MLTLSLGMATILLHGFACLPSMWSFANGRALLLPGHGPEPQLVDTNVFMDVVDAVAADLEGGAHRLVGYSLGARLALALAVRHPSRVTALVLTGVHPGLEDERERAERKRWDESMARRAEADLERFVDDWAAQPLFDSQQKLPEEVRDRLRADRLAHTARGLAWTMRVLGLGNMPPLGRALTTLEAPITIITGGHDTKFKAIADAMAAPRLSRRVVEGVGHNVALEAPQAFALLLDNL
jgi:2-succinyl-6-hydroxy-2,4-cyclohexadiene-1-carboxylate synthase